MRSSTGAAAAELRSWIRRSGRLMKMKETLEKERESLNKSDAVALKMRETLLTGEIEQNDRNLKDKKRFLTAKEEQCRDAERQIRDEEDRKYRKETELKEILNEMQERRSRWPSRSLPL